MSKLTNEDKELVQIFIENEFLRPFFDYLYYEPSISGWHFAVPPVEKGDVAWLNKMKAHPDTPKWVKLCPDPIFVAGKLLQIATVYHNFQDRGVWEEFQGLVLGGSSSAEVKSN